VARWNYSGTANAELALEQHSAFCELLRNLGVRVHCHEEDAMALRDDSDSVFVHDPAMVWYASLYVIDRVMHARSNYCVRMCAFNGKYESTLEA
jgi:N-dimethylarginine dimethylaminohydrolase